MSVQLINNNNTGSHHTIPHNNNFLLNDSFTNIINNPNLISFATHNVRNCSSETKLQNIDSFFNNFNIDILGLSETHLNLLQAHHLNKNTHNKSFKYFFHSSNRHQNCQGVGLVVRNNLSTHIFNQASFFDRIIYLDFQFKNKFKLRVIQVYLPASYHDRKDYQYRLQVQKKLMNILIDSLRHNFHIILMGDFNIDISRKYRSKLQKQLQNFLHNILNLGFIHTLTPSNSHTPYVPFLFFL